MHSTLQITGRHLGLWQQSRQPTHNIGMHPGCLSRRRGEQAFDAYLVAPAQAAEVKLSGLAALQANCHHEVCDAPCTKT